MTEAKISHVLAAANGEVVGRVRLQKIIYLLEQLGLGSDFKFSYHHYGPYSEQLSVATQREEVLEKTISEEMSQSSYGGTYSVFKRVESKLPARVGEIDFERARELTTVMKSSDSVVLELAATIHWLKEKERIAEWRVELKSRKPGKASDQNVTRALELLGNLGLVA
jgi:uncharacterized protein